MSKRMDSARDSPEVDWRSRYEMEKDENIARIREQMEAISDDIAAKANTWPNQYVATPRNQTTFTDRFQAFR